MEIIAKTKVGVIINATTDEVKEILTAVSGKCPETLDVGTRIPAIDYASTIKKVQQLGKEYAFKQLMECNKQFTKMLTKLAVKVEAASNLE